VVVPLVAAYPSLASGYIGSHSSPKLQFSQTESVERPAADNTTCESEFRPTVVAIESCQVRHYFMGEKSVGRIFVVSIFSTSLLACSDLITS